VDLGNGRILTADLWPKVRSQLKTLSQSSSVPHSQVRWDLNKTLYLQDMSLVGQCRKKCYDLIDSGVITSMVDPQHFSSLESVPDAIEYMLTGSAVGKVVVSL
jgi:NADPH:quinone reductase-like Zn-dependent oxidoreductase